jgi:hypothetical protein
MLYQRQDFSLLLGRPWQFDIISMHNGKNNYYSVMHDGKKIGLKTMTSEHLKDDLARARRVKTRRKIIVKIRLLLHILSHLSIILNLIQPMLLQFI